MTSHPPMMRVFIGPKGVRAGWRLLAFLGVAAIPAYLLIGIQHRIIPASLQGIPFIGAMILGESLLLVAVFFASGLMARIESRSFAEFGLPLRQAFRARFWQGALWGFLALTLLLLAIHAGGGFSFGGLALHGGALAKYAAAWALFFLVVGCFEEFLMRGYALFTLSTGSGFWRAALLVSVIFGAIHISNRGESWFGALSAAAISLFFCLTLRRTGSLWFAIGFHAMWDYSESFIYSVPDSGFNSPGHLLASSLHGPHWLTGGSVGPEGSWLVFILIAGLFVIFSRLCREVRFPLPSRES